MVQATIHISDDTDHIINIVKARHKLKDKSAAIDFIVAQYGAEMLEPELKPEFIEEMQQRMKGEHKGPFKNVDDLKAYIESLPDEENEQCTN